jgi:hypothetical protein
MMCLCLTSGCQVSGRRVHAGFWARGVLLVRVTCLGGTMQLGYDVPVLRQGAR